MNVFSAVAASATTFQEPSVAVVVVTGLVLVFAILILLTFIISLQGKFFSSIEKGKKPAPSQPKAAAPMAVAPVAAPAPVVEAGISEEVVAVIAAAVAAASGGKYTLRSLARASSGRGNWGAAGVVAGTEPF